MRNAGGYALITTPEPTTVAFDRLRCEEIKAGTFEADTYSCGHCQRVVHTKAKASVNEYTMCRCCMKMICPPCENTGACDPFEAKLERWEARGRALRSYGLG